MAASAGPDIVEDGLVLYLDAGNIDGFPGGEPTTNLLTNRLDLTTGWNHRDMSVSPTDDGFFRATETTTNAAHIVRQEFTTEANTVYTFSTKVKKLGRRYIGLSFTTYTNWTGGAGGHTYFDLDTVSVIRSISTGPLDSGIEDIGNQTFLLWITALSTNIVTSATNLFTYADLNFTTFVGDPNLGFLTKEFQLEKKMYPTPFVDGTRNNWKDLSGNEKNGTFTNGPVFNRSNNGSIEFDGSDDYYITGTPDIRSTSYTIEAWCNLTEINRYNPILGDYQYNWFGIFFDSSNNLVARHKYTNTEINQASYSMSSILTTDTWYSIGVVFDISAGKYLYVNGELVAQNSDTREWLLAPDRGPQYIGRNARSAPGTPDYFYGKISTIKIRTVALTSQEIQQNYNATKSRFYDI